ncbi:MAG: hypothetical protein ACFFD4_22065 [Candidatus Odinarchaeota archaeon]
MSETLLEKFSLILEEQEIIELPLNGAEAKELILAYLRQREVPIHKELHGELLNINKARNGDDESVNIDKSLKLLQELDASSFREFKVILGMGYARGFINGSSGQRNPLTIIPLNKNGTALSVLELKSHILPGLSKKQDHPGQKLILSTTEQLIRIFGLDWLVTKASVRIAEKYDSIITEKQARAVIRRVMGIKLSSTERSHLHELRKKIGKYKRLIEGFEKHIEVKTRIPLSDVDVRGELIPRIFDRRKELEEKK